MSRSFHSREAARKWRNDTEDAIRSGKIAQRIAAQQTLESLIDDYVALPSRAQQKSKHGSDALLYAWVVALDDYAPEKVKVEGMKVGGSIAIGAVTTKMVQDELNEMLDSGNEPGTVNRKRNALHAFFRWCVKCGVVTVNPVTKKLPEPRGRVRWLSDDERVELFKACRESKCAALYPLVVVACYSAMPRGEIMRLAARGESA